MMNVADRYVEGKAPGMRKEPVSRTELLLSLERALVGAVPASLRKVTCDWTDTKILRRFILDGPIDSDEYEDMQVVGTEVIADLPPRLEMRAYMRKEGPIGPPHETPARSVTRVRSS